MSKTAFLVAALFAASMAFGEAPAPKTKPVQTPVKTQPVAGSQSGGAPVIAGGVAQSGPNPAMIAIGVAVVAVVVAASLSSDSGSNH